MLQVFKRVEKSLDNPYGVISVQSLSELNNPFLICLSAQDLRDRSVFGMIKTGAKAARVNTPDEIGAGFKIEELPLHFLGMRFKKDDSYQRNYEEIVDSYIYPFLIGDKTRNVEDIKKLARRINFMTYCDGTITYQNIERRLEERFESDGYTKEEIAAILSQISLVAIGTMAYTGNLKAQTVTFIDLNDEEIYTSRTEGHKRILQEKKVNSICGKLKNSNNLLYIFNGSGKHSLKEYFLDNCKAKAAISGVLTSFLENSITNENSAGLVGISSKEILSRLKKYGDDQKDSLSLLHELDESLSYGDSPRYSENEAVLRCQLDEAYKKVQIVESRVASLELENQKLKSAVEGVRIYSSDVTYKQILASAGMWQISPGEDILSKPSDKDIRHAYDQLLNNKGPKL